MAALPFTPFHLPHPECLDEKNPTLTSHLSTRRAHTGRELS